MHVWSFAVNELFKKKERIKMKYFYIIGTYSNGRQFVDSAGYEKRVDAEKSLACTQPCTYATKVIFKIECLSPEDLQLVSSRRTNTKERG